MIIFNCSQIQDHFLLQNMLFQFCWILKRMTHLLTSTLHKILNNKYYFKWFKWQWRQKWLLHNRHSISTPKPIHYDITPIHNYSRDTINAEDVENWSEKIENDEEPDHRPFLDTCELNLDNDSCNPEDFFNNLFDERMFTIMADATNQYAQQKICSILRNRDTFQQIEHHSHRRSTKFIERYECSWHKTVHSISPSYVFCEETCSS